MLSATLTDAILTEKPVVRFTAEKLLNTSFTVKDDGVYYAVIVKHANIIYRVQLLNINDRIRLSGNKRESRLQYCNRNYFQFRFYDN